MATETETAIIQELKALCAKSVCYLVREGLMELFGHVSARIPGTDRFVMLGHLQHLDAKTLAEVTADDMITLNFAGEVLEGRWENPEEIWIHIGIYERRPDVGSVVHCHPAMATAFSIARQPILPVVANSVYFGPSVPIFDKAAQIDHPEIGRELAEALGDRPAILLRGHGVVTAGKDVQQATHFCHQLERTARMQWLAAVVGDPSLVTVADVGDEFVQRTKRRKALF